MTAATSMLLALVFFARAQQDQDQLDNPFEGAVAVLCATSAATATVLLTVARLLQRRTAIWASIVAAGALVCGLIAPCFVVVLVLLDYVDL